ncbi:MAG: WYL domain-containing protein [Nitriliruptorales bacterium]|nr:WYL domain-containing protein [Nitriliruptorales bacterium]
MTAADDAVRMLTLVPWLIERPGASIQEAAQTFGVTETVVRRDLERLDFCGLPGLGGGDLFEITIVGERILVQMADELRRPLRLSPREALRLVLAIEAVAVAFGDELPALRSAVDKIRRAAGMEEGVAVELDPEGGRWLAPVRRALADERRLRVRYQGRTDAAPRDRSVDPWALRVVDGAWYLQGRDDDAEGLRTFRLDRVADIDVLDEPRRFEPPDDELPIPRYVPAEDDIEVHLHLEPRATWLIDAIEPEHVAEFDSGVVEVRFHSDALAWVRRLLLGAGGGVDVRAPQALAEDLRSDARRALRHYRDVVSEVAPEPWNSDSS